MGAIQPTVLGLATHVPPYRYAQMDIYERLIVPRFGASRLARWLFRSAQIDSRYYIFPDTSFYNEPRSTEARNNAYMEHARPFGAEAIRRCLADAGLTPQDVDDLFIVSCTGFDTPGLDLFLAADLGMRHDLRRTDILGMGCYAAFPGLARAANAVRANPAARALVLCVELGSLHFQDDSGLDNMTSMALFGDGAAAILIGAGTGGPRLLDHRTFSDYQTLEHMAFHLTDHGFAMRLSNYVPDLLRAQVGPVIDRILQPNGLRREDIRFWGIHPGGARILDYLQAELGLPPDALRFSRAVLRRYGNMSSPTALFVLEEIRRTGDPQPGDYGLLMAFGPGLTMETCLVQW